MLETFLLDARHALRSLARSPTFVVITVLSTAFGVGVNTAVFSWLDTLVLHPFPAVEQPDRVVGVESVSPGNVESPVSYPMVREWRRTARTVSRLAAWTITRVAGRAEGDRSAAPLIAMAVSGAYFDVFGTTGALGRVLTEADERARAPVVVLGYEFWRRQYGEDPRALGRTLFLNGVPFTVIGVAGRRFAGTYVGVVPDVFVPVTLQPALAGRDVLDDGRARVFQVVARLAQGATAADCQRELDALTRRLSHDAGDRPVVGAVVKDIRTQYLGGIMFPILSATLVVTGMMLLIACANIGSLLVVRATARSRDLALRLALGAPPRRIARLVLTEATMLTVAGGVVGVALANVARGWLVSLFPTGAFPITLPIDLNVRVLLFALGSVVTVTMLCAWLPALRAVTSPPASALRTVKQSFARSGTRARSAVASLQLAFSLVCVVTAGLFVRALQRGTSVNVGFSDPKSVLLLATDLAAARFGDTARVVALRQVLARTRALPGVVNASAATVVPLGLGGVRTVDVRVEGYAPAADESMSAFRNLVGSDYAHTLGMRVMAGRDLTDADRSEGTPVALVNEEFARRFWPNGSAVGERLDAGHGWATIVGVLANGKYGTLSEAPQLAVYLPLEQWPQPAVTLHIRAAANPLALGPLVRDILSAVHPDLPALQPRTLAAHIEGATFVPRVGVRVIGAFAVAALALAGLGLYGALAITVALRSRELAIRMALGAGRGSILRSIGGQLGRIAGAGLSLGTVLLVFAVRALRTQPLDISGIDRVTYVIGMGVLVVAIVVAATLPAWRALRVEPIAALRGD